MYFPTTIFMNTKKKSTPVVKGICPHILKAILKTSDDNCILENGNSSC